MAKAVRTGSVLFSTTILSDWATSPIRRAVFSQNCKSAAMPSPLPKDFVGVFTETKMISDSSIAASMSLLKNRFSPRVVLTSSSRPGS